MNQAVSQAVAATRAKPAEKMSTKNLDFYYGDNRALKSVTVPFYLHQATAFIGPSGCGKSTLLRVLNRMYDLYPRQRATGCAVPRPPRPPPPPPFITPASTCKAAVSGCPAAGAWYAIAAEATVCGGVPGGAIAFAAATNGATGCGFA